MSDWLLQPGIVVREVNWLYEDEIQILIAYDVQVLVGTRPLLDIQKQARQWVRDGMADVLEWLGEPVELPLGLDLLRVRIAQVQRLRRLRAGPSPSRSGSPSG